LRRKILQPPAPQTNRNIAIFKPPPTLVIAPRAARKKALGNHASQSQLQTSPSPTKFIEPQNIAQRPRHKISWQCPHCKNLQKSRGKILTKQSDKEAGRRTRRTRGVKFLPKRSTRAKMKFQI